MGSSDHQVRTSHALQETWSPWRSPLSSVFYVWLDVEDEERGDQKGGQIVQAPCPLAFESLPWLCKKNLREPDVRCDLGPGLEPPP